MRKVLALVLALPLAGCFNPFVSIPNPANQTNLYQAELIFDGSVKTFNELKALCANRTLPPKCRTYVKQGQGLIIKARDADLAAREFVDSNPTLDATSIVSAFTTLASQFVTTTNNLGAVQ